MVAKLPARQIWKMCLLAMACPLVAGALLFLIIGGAVFRADVFSVAVVAGTAGTLILLVAYFMTNIGSIKLLFFSGRSEVARWEILIPALGYTMFRNVYPFPSGSAWWGPGVFLAVVALAALWILAKPGAARRAGQLLARPGRGSGRRRQHHPVRPVRRRPATDHPRLTGNRSTTTRRSRWPRPEALRGGDAACTPTTRRHRGLQP